MSDRTRYSIYMQDEQLLVTDEVPFERYQTVAIVLAEDAEDAQCLADYLWARVWETYQHLLNNSNDNGQLLRGLIRRFVHHTYAHSTSVQAYPLVPEYLSDAGENKEDES